MTSKALALIQLRSRSILKYLKHNLASTAIRLLIALAVLLTVALTSVSVKAQCPTTVLASDLRAPTKIILSQNGNLLVAEQGNGPNTGRIAILDPNTDYVLQHINGIELNRYAVGGSAAVVSAWTGHARCCFELKISSS